MVFWQLLTAWCLDGMPGVSTRRKPWRWGTETLNFVHVQRSGDLRWPKELAHNSLGSNDSSGLLEVLPKLRSCDHESERAHQYANILHLKQSIGGHSNIDKWCTAALRVLWQSERDKVQCRARPRFILAFVCKGFVHKCIIIIIWYNTLLLFWTGVKLTQKSLSLLAFVDVGYSMLLCYCFINICSNESAQNSKQFGRWHWWTGHTADGSLVMHCSLVPDDAVYTVYPVYPFI